MYEGEGDMYHSSYSFFSISLLYTFMSCRIKETDM